MAQMLALRILCTQDRPSGSARCRWMPKLGKLSVSSLHPSSFIRLKEAEEVEIAVGCCPHSIAAG